MDLSGDRIAELTGRIVHLLVGGLNIPASAYNRHFARVYQEISTEIETMKAGRTLTCVYCGHEYPQGTPAAGSDVLTAHIRECPEHPLRQAEIQVRKLRRALEGLVGASSKEELEAMMKVMSMAPDIPDVDAARGAIRVLLDALPPQEGGAS